MGEGATSPRERIRSEAAAWVVALSDPARDVDRAGFEAWRSTSLEHEIAFEREAAAWERLERLRALRPAEVVPDPDLFAPEPPPRRQARGLERWTALAASLVLVVACAGAGAYSLMAAPAYATGLGERRLVVLPDRTTVELNTNSKIIVRYREGRRIVELVRGEAMFHIARDARPFVVQARGTRLDAERVAAVAVRLADAGAEVTVKAGVVHAKSSGAAAADVASLGSNSEALLGPDGAQVHKVSTEELDRTLAWRQGAIALNDQTLSQAVAEFNRYNSRKIVVGDAAAANIRVGGYFDALDVDGFVGAVVRTFPVHAAARPDGSVVLTSAA